jgi:hypothetical protein
VSRCLGPRIADLADGRLEPAEAERALAHVAACTTCRDALVAQRAVISRLDTVDPVDPPSELLGRLIGIAAPSADPLPGIPEQGGAGWRPGGAAGRAPRGTAPGSTRPPARRHRGRIALAGAAGAVAMAVAIVVGGSSALTSTVVPRSPSIAPVVDTLAVEHAVSADQMPFSGPRIVTVGYAGPAAPDTAQPSPTP